MPNGEEFEKQLADWEEKFQLHRGQADLGQQQITDYGRQLEELTKSPPTFWEMAQFPVPKPPLLVEKLFFPYWAAVATRKTQVEEIKGGLSLAVDSLEKSDFFARLYGEVPLAISGGQVSSAEEALALLVPPNTLTADELADVRDTISGMVATITQPPEIIPPEEMEYPELIAPVPVAGVPVSIHQLSVREIVKSLKTPRVPDSAMTQEEWNKYLKLKGYTDEDIDKEIQIAAEELINSWADRTAQIDGFRAGVAELPEYTLADMLKEMMVQPGLALMELAYTYRQRVSLPLAGGAWKNVYPDLELEYQRYKAANPDVGTWMALGHAYESWEGVQFPEGMPWCGVGEWMLKYILMEGVVDPLTYVGWGIATKLTRPLGRFGRLVGSAERGVASVFEMPFNLVKRGWNVLPKTITQRATLARMQAAQQVERFTTKFTGRHVTAMSSNKFTKACEKAIKYTLDNPQAQDDIALAGREMLMHAPVDEALTKSWSARLGSTLRSEDITKVTVENIDNIFEDMFMRKLITPREASGQLLKIFNVSISDDVIKIAQKILTARAEAIKRGAIAFTRARTPAEAITALANRNFRIHITAENSAAALARKETGAFSTLLFDTSNKLQAIWRDGIDKWVVRPTAEAYLTFGMYGPMNVLEDYGRSILGGVLPRRMNVEGIEKLFVGLLFDPNLKRPGLSEMLGFLRRPGAESTHNNWILQLAAGGKKKWGAKLYEVMVERPGAYGMDVRRNFMAGKYLQVLADEGGDTVQALIKAGPKKVPPEITGSALRKEIERTAYYFKTSGSDAPETLRLAKDLFTRTRIVRNEVSDICKEVPGLPNTVRNHILTQYDDGILLRSADDIERVVNKEAREMLLEDFLRGPEVAAEQYKMLSEFLTALEVRSPQEMATAIQAVHKMSEIYGALPDQIIARATVKSRGLPLAERRAAIDIDLDRIHLFLDSAGANIDDVIKTLEKRMTAAGLPDNYQAASRRAFDVMTTKREYATEFRSQNMATRHEIFAGVSKKEMTSEFWDDFYLQMNNDYRLFNGKMAELDGLLVRAVEELNTAAGVKLAPRAPIVVKGRPLAPQDVANLLGVRGDDISRGLLDVLTIQNNKDMFVSYVQAMTRPGDVGFTKEAIGTVYDQMAYSLRVSPESMSWITSKQIELESVRRELHSLLNSKMLPDNEIAAIGKYFDDVAGAVDDVMFKAAPPAKLPKGMLDIGKLRELGELPNVKISGSFATGKATPKSDLDILIGLTDAEWARITPRQAPDVLERIVRLLPEDRMDIKLYKISNPDELWYFLRGKKGVSGVFVPVTDKPQLSKRLWADAIDIGAAPPIKLPPAKVIKPEYADFDKMRQRAYDEAAKWYYKEYPDYTNANAFDSMMKTIYPYWTYESQRWFWLPREFIRHPGIFMSFERFQDNTDYGYTHIPGTSIDINPFRGTIFGTLTTRLTRRDFPEYYDSLGAAGGLIEFNDYLTRFGFYPGAHISIPLAMFGGAEQQMGETIPAVWKTPLNALIAAFPKSENVKWLSDHIFSDRFRDYMTILEVNKRGYNGSHLWTKVKEGIEMTPEEQSIWDDSRGEAAFYGIGFEQFGMFRLRTDEQYRAYEESAKVLEEMTGYTPEQQDWLRRHGYRIWDMVGGISDTNQAILQELESYKWLGSVTPLLPSRQQKEIMRLDLDWDNVTTYAESKQQERLQLQQDFSAGRIGPRDYVGRLQAIYSDQRAYIEGKMEENPNMTLEGREEYRKRYDIVIPVQHPSKELRNLYFSIELNTEAIDPETGEIYTDWDSFYAQRMAIEDAMPEEVKAEWEAYLSRNTTRVEEIRQNVNEKYFRKYYDIWDATLSTYPENEQELVREFLYLERTGQQLTRQGEIKELISSKTGNQLISSFRSDVSDNRAALRHANPTLDAWLFYWGRVSSFQTSQAESIYKQLLLDTGRKG